MAAGNTTAASKAVKLQRQAAALELRRAGADYRTIAHQLGIGKSQAHSLVKQALGEAVAEIQAEATQLKAEEVSRLNGLLAQLWTKAKGGDLGAVDRVLRVMERKAKLLGLDAPVKLAHAGPNGGAIPVRNDGIDLRNLTDEQLAQYEALVLATAAQPGGDPAGVGVPPA